MKQEIKKDAFGIMTEEVKKKGEKKFFLRPNAEKRFKGISRLCHSARIADFIFLSTHANSPP